MYLIDEAGVERTSMGVRISSKLKMCRVSPVGVATGVTVPAYCNTADGGWDADQET